MQVLVFAVCTRLSSLDLRLIFFLCIQNLEELIKYLNNKIFKQYYILYVRILRCYVRNYNYSSRILFSLRMIGDEADTFYGLI